MKMILMMPTAISLFLSAQVYAGGACLLKKYSNSASWFIQQNGSNLTSNYTNIQGAVDRLVQLRQDGICPAPVANTVSCAIKKTENGNWFVNLNGDRISSSYTNIDGAISEMKRLFASSVCSPYVATGCEIRKTAGSNIWKVFQLGSTLSSSYTNFDSAKAQLKSLKGDSVCRLQPEAKCILKKRDNSDSWYVEQDGKSLTNSYTKMSSAISLFKNLTDENVCQLNFETACELKKRDGVSSWFVEVGGSKITATYTNIDSAIEQMTILKANNVCQSYLRQPCKISKRESSNAWIVNVGGANISGASFTNIQSAITQFKDLVDKNLCQDSHYNSPCVLNKSNSQELWRVEQDGKALTQNFTTIAGAKSLLNQLQESKTCNLNLQQGCQVVKRQNSNSWYVSQNGQQLSNSYNNIDSASAQFRDFYQTGICKRGECEIRQEVHGAVSIVRNGYSLNLSDDLDSAITAMTDLIESNTCDLPQNAKLCNIRNNNGYFHLMDELKPIGSSEDYYVLTDLRSRLQTMGYCQILNPSDIFITNSGGANQGLDGPRSDVVMQYLDGNVISPNPQSVPR